MATSKSKNSKSPAPKAKAKATKSAPKKVAAKAVKKTVAKKPAPAKSKAKAAPVKAKAVPAKKISPAATKKAAPSKNGTRAAVPVKIVEKAAAPAKPAVPVKVTGFLLKQRDRLLQLKDILLDSMNGVARDTLRSRPEGSEASAFGMHQADAGSDAYDRDFALSLLSQEQNSLYEINQALKRIETGTYGNCEMSGKPIPHARLEALPFTRYTVECQAELEKRNRYQRNRQPVTSLFGLDEDGGDGDEEETTTEKE